MNINKNFLNLKDDYLFAETARRIAAYRAANPDKEVIRLSIGDVTLPLAKSVVAALQKASAEMGEKATFKGYGDYEGYGFLRDAVIDYYAGKGVTLERPEVFISDGAKSDLANILDLFSADNTVLIPDPVYPVYLDTNIMAGRKIIFTYGNEGNGFLPLPDEKVHADIIYICSPNNPTGAVYNKEQLKKWVDYALDNNALIIFDAAYEAFIRDPALPTSIYQIEGAERCAIEFCSLSKTAGFTGTRCGYTVIPSALTADGVLIRKLWLRRQSTKFNGVPYIVQRGAEAVFSPEGQKEIRENIAYYMENADLISSALKEKGIWHVGGANSPYIWLKCPDGTDSWTYFDNLLNNVQVAGTPGAGFGKSGEGYFRLTAFGSRESVKEAIKRL